MDLPDFNPFNFNVLINTFNEVYLITISSLEYVFATIFLIMGILLIYKQYFVRRRNVKIKLQYFSPVIPEYLLGLIYIFIAIGIYFRFLLNFIYFLSVIGGPPLIFYILNSLNISELGDALILYNSEWSELSNIQLFIMLIIGTISILGGISLIFGISVFIRKGLYGKKMIGVSSIIGGTITLIIIGISPGIKLLLY